LHVAADILLVIAFGVIALMVRSFARTGEACFANADEECFRHAAKFTDWKNCLN